MTPKEDLISWLNENIDLALADELEKTKYELLEYDDALEPSQLDRELELLGTRIKKGLLNVVSTYEEEEDECR